MHALCSELQTQDTSRVLKNSANGVFASLRGSTYGLDKRLFIQEMGGRVKTDYDSHLHSLRPCSTAFLNTLRASLMRSAISSWLVFSGYLNSF
jgi:hypothetical protein